MSENLITIREPKPEEMEDFYSLRWEVMRKPLGMVKGTERFDKDDEAMHMALFSDDKMVAEVTAYQLSDTEMMLSHLATLPEQRGRGYGRLLVDAVEVAAQKLSFHKIVLDAREDVVGFYKKQGYENHGYVKTFADIKHYRMTKDL